MTEDLNGSYMTGDTSIISTFTVGVRAAVPDLFVLR